MTRKEAIELLHTYVKNPNLIKHSLASEAVMRALAVRLGGDPDLWGLAGLLHDLDAELEPDLSTHTVRTTEILKSKKVPEEVINAIKLHNELPWGEKRWDPMHFALAAGENLTGLIIASALVVPEKKLESLQVKSVIKRMKEKRFAPGANRETIKEALRLGLSLEEFVEICLNAMKNIAHQLGL
mgnify:CR=1 FL=1